MAETAKMIRQMLRTRDAASYVGLAESTLEKLRLTGGGPRYIKMSKAVAYDPTDLDAWLEANKRRSTTSA